MRRVALNVFPQHSKFIITDEISRYVVGTHHDNTCIVFNQHCFILLLTIYAEDMALIIEHNFCQKVS